MSSEEQRGRVLMETEIDREWVLKVLLAVVGVVAVWALQRGGLLSSIRRRGKARVEARRQFVQGAQLLGRSRSSSTPSEARALAREAADAADKAIALDPKDAACYILKGLALEGQGHTAAAIECFDAALSPKAANSLSASEKSDALLKRAALFLAPSSPSGSNRRLDSAIADLQASHALNKENAKVLCLLGTCYEEKGLRSEARRAFQDALGVDPSSRDAKAGLSRLV